MSRKAVQRLPLLEIPVPSYFETFGGSGKFPVPGDAASRLERSFNRKGQEMLPYDVLTFDCYGTLIDWETGMRDAIAGLIRSRGLSLSPDEVHRTYGRLELELQHGPFRSYREVLRGGLVRAFQEHGVELTPLESDRFAESLPSWPRFPDSTEVLRRLKDRGYKLAILSNIDDDLIRQSIRVLGVEFDGVVTAEQVGSYKPSHNHWTMMLENFDVAKDRVLHVAQSYVHDIEPAKAQGFATAWINRYAGAPGGAVRADYEFPDLRGLLTIL